jgi:hypothetical protein
MMKLNACYGFGFNNCRVVAPCGARRLDITFLTRLDQWFNQLRKNYGQDLQDFSGFVFILKNPVNPVHFRIWTLLHAQQAHIA